MAIKVKSAAQSSAKWARNAGAASQEYAEQAAGAGQTWQANAAAAASTYKASLSQGDIGARFSSGVQRAGAAKYTRKVTGVGAQRYSGGVADGQVEYESGVTGVLQTIASVNLPARKPRGDPGNIERVRAIASALSARRLGSAAAGR